MEDRILIVDDKEMIYSLVAKRLAKDGYACVMANNGREALRNFYKNNLSLIISDIRMPEINGLELLKNVKTAQPNIMFNTMTTYPEIDLAVEAIRLERPTSLSNWLIWNSWSSVWIKPLSRRRWRSRSRL